MSNFSSIPAEIIELIVSFVPKTSLRALSLTSPHFTEPCQRRLFSALKLEARLAANQRDGVWASYRGALAHLSAHPRLATYITHLKVYLRKPWKPYPWSDAGEGDLAALESVFDLLERLEVSVHRLKIRGPSRTEDWEDWMLTAVRRMIAHTLRNPTGTGRHLSMKAIDNIPIHDVYRALWACHSLALQDLYVSEPGQHPPLEAPAVNEQLIGGPALRKLKIFGTNYLYDVLLQPGLRRYTNSITTLSIDGFGPPYGDQVALGLELAALCSTTLEDLTVIFNSWRMNEHNTLQHCLPNLRKLTLLSKHQQLITIPHWTLHHALASLLHDRRRTHLPALTNLLILVGITLDDRIEPPLAPYYVLSPQFAELDAVLLPYCTSTATVEFGVQHHLFYEPETPDERKLDLEAHYAAFSDAVCGALARAFAVGLKLVPWDDTYER
ncbi:hypothetical protein HMN09_01102200 [Mycena chlorophos]|uniref:F-box domain-containing protein n=1 Tax=Mycena chlorophos TaxID=658473 RepID=A0A8H6SBD8_MYCCL|nr:hypothetical protein HMN09_01102200 [Mycena chlorophos]